MGDADLALADAGLKVRNGQLVKVDAHENTVAAIPLSDIVSARCRRSVSFSNFFVSAFLLWLTRFIFISSESFVLRWLLAPAVGIVGVILLLGATIENELEIKTKETTLKFLLPGDVRDAKAFAVSLVNLKRGE